MSLIYEPASKPLHISAPHITAMYLSTSHQVKRGGGTDEGDGGVREASALIEVDVLELEASCRH